MFYVQLGAWFSNTGRSMFRTRSSARSLGVNHPDRAILLFVQERSERPRKAFARLAMYPGQRLVNGVVQILAYRVMRMGQF